MSEENVPNEIAEPFVKEINSLTGADSLRYAVSRDERFVLKTICDRLPAQTQSLKNTLFSVAQEKTLLILKATGEVLHEFGSDSGYDSFQFIGPAGRFLCLRHLGDHGLEIWDAETVTKLCSPSHGNVSHSPTADPAGEKIIVGFHDGTVSLFNAIDGRQIHALIDINSVCDKQGKAICLTAMNSDGTQCLAIDYDGILHLWDTETGQLIYSSPRISFKPNKVRFLSDGRIMLKDAFSTTILDPNETIETGYKAESTKTVRTGERKFLSPIRTIKRIRGGVHDLAVSPDGLTAAASSDVTNELRVYDLRKRTLTRIIKSTPQWIRELKMRQFSQNGKSLYEINKKSFRQMSIPDGDILHEWNLPLVDDQSYEPTAWIKGHVVSPDGSHVFICGEERKGLLLNANDGSIIREIKFKNKRYVLYLPIFSPNGKYIAVTDTANTMIVFDLEGNVLYEEAMKKLDPCPLCWSSDSNSLFIGRKKDIVKLDLQSKQFIETYPVKRGNVLAGNLSADQTRLIIYIDSASTQNHIIVDTSTKMTLFERTNVNSPSDICRYADGDSVLLVPGDNLEILDAKTFEMLSVIEEWPGKVSCTNVFLPDEKSLLFQDGSLSRCIDLETGSESGRIVNFVPNGQVEFLSDQTSMVNVCNLSSLEIYDLSTLKKVKKIPVCLESNIEVLPISPDGTKLYAGSEDKRAVYSLPYGKKLYDIGQINGRHSKQGCFSPDSRYLLLAFPHSGIALLDANSGNIVRDMRLDQENCIINGIHFNPNGKYFAIPDSNSDKMIRIYETETFLLVREYMVADQFDFFNAIHFPPCMEGTTQNWAVCKYNTAMEVFDWMTGEKIKSLPFGETDLFCAKTDLLRERIYFATVKGEIKVLHTGDWCWTDTVETGISGIKSLDISPDGHRLLLQHKNGIELYSTETFRHLGTIPPRYTLDSTPDFLVQLSPGWRWLSVGPSWSKGGENDDELYLFDLSSLE